MNWFSHLFSNDKSSPSNDTSSEEMEEMIFNDPEGDDYLQATPDRLPACFPSKDDRDSILLDPPDPPQENQSSGPFGWLFGK